jgi:hypothetical protein
MPKRGNYRPTVLPTPAPPTPQETLAQREKTIASLHKQVLLALDQRDSARAERDAALARCATLERQLAQIHALSMPSAD